LISRKASGRDGLEFITMHFLTGKSLPSDRMKSMADPSSSRPISF
jgi:hypothetical protein